MRILGLIPARGGSKGVPRKNIRLLGNRPLLQYTIEAARFSHGLTDIILSTDDTEIAKCGLELGVEVPFMRPQYLATDEASSIDVVVDVIQQLKKQGREYEAVCLLQPTSPFRVSGFIDQAIAKFQEGNTDSLLSVLEVPHEYNPHWVYEQDEKGMLRISTGEREIVKRRQDLPKAFHRDGSIYLTKTQVILEQKSFYGASIGFIQSDPQYSCNIDTLKDWVLAEQKIKDLNLR